MLRSRLFPLSAGRVLISDVCAWLAECEKAGLVRCYEVNFKRYLVIPKFRQKFRAKDSKFPPPPSQADDGQMSGTCTTDEGHTPRTCTTYAHGDGDGDEKTESKTQGGGETAHAHIPSVKEVQEYGSIHGVPLDYCLHYHAVCSEKHRWLVGKPGAERLIGWQSEIKRWWEKDRITWKSNGTRAESREIQEQINVKRL